MLRPTARVAVMLSALLFSFSVTAGPELVSSDAAGTPLTGNSLVAQGISEDGRYVLLTDQSSCTVYRKDRDSGELLTVLESSDDGYEFCGNAQISDDGNLVAASPTQLFPSECIDERADENGDIGCYFGELTELLIKNIGTGAVTEIKRDYISQSAGDIGRIPGETTFRYGVALIDFAGDGGHAVTGEAGIQDGLIRTLYRLIDISAGTSVAIAPPVGENETLQINSASISDDGNRLALLASIVTPPNPPSGMYCPGPAPGPGLPPTDQPTGPSGTLICGQTGRCDTIDIGDNTGSYGGSQTGDSWWEWSYNPECRPQVQGPDVFIWDRVQQTLTAMNATQGEGVLPNVSGPVISGDGYSVAWFNRAGICSGLDANTGGFVTYPCDADENICDGANCGSQLYLANLLASTRELITSPDVESDLCAFFPGRIGLSFISVAGDCAIELSDDGSQVLYARTVTHPFGGDWSVNNSGYAICIDRVAWETTGEALDVPCTDGGGFPGPIIPGPILPGPGPLCGDPNDPLNLQPCEPLQPSGGLNNYFGGYTPDPEFNNQYNKSVVSGFTATASSADGTLEIGESVTFGDFTITLTAGGPATVSGNTVSVASGGTLMLNEASITFSGEGAITVNGDAISINSQADVAIDGPLDAGDGGDQCSDSSSGGVIVSGGGLNPNYRNDCNAGRLVITGGEIIVTGGGGLVVNGDLVVINPPDNGGVITPVPGGPIIGIPFSNVLYSEPLIWHLYAANTGHTTLVSINSENELFHAAGAKLAGNGSAWAFDSRDPRLQDVAVTPAAASEAELDEACLWSPAGKSADLRIMTNDNVTTDVGIEVIEYPGTPVLCPIPDPEFARHVFADDLGEIDASVMTFRQLRGWQSGPAKMQTWYGNFSDNDATLVAINLEINGLGEDGSIDIDESCDVYPPAGDDDSWLVRCEIGALPAAEINWLPWQISSPERAFIKIVTSIETNEHDARPRWNEDTDRVVIWKPRGSFWEWLRSRRQ
ncbi:MAG: hypothetical protein ACR2QG_07680 [Gammaproteobacteria bacterium]